VDGGKALHNNAARRKSPRAIGQGHGDDHRQELRGQTNCESERKQQRFEKRAMEHDIGGDYEQHEEDR
jgi:hypothetical protein